MIPTLDDQSSHTPSPLGVLHQRRTIAVASLLIFIITFGYFGLNVWPTVLYRYLTDGLIVLAWLATADGIGRVIWHAIAVDCSPGVRRCSSIALGLGAIGLICLMLGLGGLLNRSTSWAILLVGITAFGVRIGRRVMQLDRAALGAWLGAPVPALWWIAAAMPLIAITTITTLAPPGVLWGDEPNGYDVAEYHLQIPREWYESGTISPLAHNVFSYFPQGMEMHYLLAMHLRGGPWAGMYVAQIMHAAMIALAVASVVSFAGEQSRASGAVAGLAMCSTPWLMLLAPVAYNEGALLLYGSLAIGWASRTLQKSSGDSTSSRVAMPAKQWIISGLFTGLACGAKLTAGPMLLVALPVAALAAWLTDRPSMSLGRFLKCLTLIVVVALIVQSPWLIRNLTWTGNPVFPEMTGLFGNGHGRLSVDQIERWRIANHLPGVAVRSLAGRCTELLRQIAFDWRYGIALLPMGVVAAAMSWRRERGAAVLLLALLGFMLVFWFGFTHLQSRFFVLSIPVAALAVGQFASSLHRQIAAVLLVIALIIGIANLSTRYAGESQVLDTLVQNRVLGIEQLDDLSGADIRREPAEATVVLVGDAKAFFYSRPMTKLRYRTVFDAGSIQEGWLSAWVNDADLANSTVVISPMELARLSRTYWKLPAPPDEVLREGSTSIRHIVNGQIDMTMPR